MEDNKCGCLSIQPSGLSKIEYCDSDIWKIGLVILGLIGLSYMGKALLAKKL